MIRWFCLACALIVGIGLCTYVYQTQPEPVPDPTVDVPRKPEGPPPKLEVVGEKAHQFGSMLMGDKGSRTWEFKNVGTGPMDVWLEHTSCSCTVATLKGADGEVNKRITIKPGGSTPIEVTWEGRKPGRYAQEAILGTTDPEQPSVTLTVLGVIVPPVDVRPSDAVSFPGISAEEGQGKTVTIVSEDYPGLKLTKVATSLPGLIVAEPKPMTAEELERLKARSGYHLTIKVKPGMPTGRFAEQLIIETDHPKQPSVKVYLKGDVVGPIAVIPSELSMPNVAGVAGASQDLSLIVRGGRETHFEVASKSDKLQVAIRPDSKPESQGRYRLTVTIPPGTSPGPVREPIVLKTDHPTVKELRIPVAVYISSRSDAG